MSTIDEPRVEDPDVGASGDDDVRRRIRRRRRILVSPIVLVALVLLVPALWGAVVGLRKVSQPEAFGDTTGAVGGFSGRAEPGDRYSFGITFGPLPDVTMRSTEVFLTEGSVAAATTISLCRWNPAQEETTGPIGVWEGDLGEFCTSLEPLDGRDLGELGPKDNLVLTVVPLEQGTVHVTGYELVYDQDGRRGEERVDVDLRVGETP